MASYYVNNTAGSDLTGDGSSGNPWASINKAVTTLASGTAKTDNTVYVKYTGTVYNESGIIVSYGCTIRRWDDSGTRPTIRKSAGSAYQHFEIRGAAALGVKFEQLIFDQNTHNDVISVYKTNAYRNHDVELVTCDIINMAHTNNYGLQYTYNATYSNTFDIKFDNCLIDGDASTAHLNTNAGIYIYGGDSGKYITGYIRDCEIKDIKANAAGGSTKSVQIAHCHCQAYGNFKIQRNLFHDNNFNIYINAAYGQWQIENNIYYNTAYDTILITMVNNSQHYKILGNTFYNPNGTGDNRSFIQSENDDNSAVTGNIIYGNIFDKTGVGCWDVNFSDAGADLAQAKHNIFGEAGYRIAINAVQQNPNIDNVVSTQWTAGTMFQDIGSYNFALKTSVNNLALGQWRETTHAPADDYNGTTRVANDWHDCGAITSGLYNITWQVGRYPTAGYDGIDDVYIEQTDVNREASTSLYIRNDTGWARERTLIRCDFAGLPSGVTVKSCWLDLLGTGGGGVQIDIDVYRIRVGRDWIDSQAIYSNYKTATAWGTAGCENTTTDRRATSDLTLLDRVYIALRTPFSLLTCYNNGITAQGIMMKSTTFDAAGALVYASNSNATAANRPMWTIAYNPPTRAIKTLASQIRLESLVQTKTLASRIRLESVIQTKTLASRVRLESVIQVKTLISRIRLESLVQTKTLASQIRLESLVQAKTLVSRVILESVVQTVTLASSISLISIAQIIITLSSQITLESLVQTIILPSQIALESEVQIITLASQINLESEIQIITLPSQVTLESEIQVITLASQVTLESEVQIITLLSQIALESEIQIITLPSQVTLESEIQVITLASQVTLESEVQIITLPSQITLESLIQTITLASQIRLVFTQITMLPSQINLESEIQVITLPSQISLESLVQTVVLASQINLESEIQVVTLFSQINLESEIQVVVLPSQINLESLIQAVVLASQINIESELQSITLSSQINLESLIQAVTLVSQINLESETQVMTLPSQINLESEIQITTLVSQINLESEIQTIILVSIINIESTIQILILTSQISLESLIQTVTLASQISIEAGLQATILYSQIGLESLIQSIILTSQINLESEIQIITLISQINLESGVQVITLPSQIGLESLIQTVVLASQINLESEIQIITLTSQINLKSEVQTIILPSQVNIESLIQSSILTSQVILESLIQSITLASQIILESLIQTVTLVSQIRLVFNQYSVLESRIWIEGIITLNIYSQITLESVIQPQILISEIRIVFIRSSSLTSTIALRILPTSKPEVYDVGWGWMYNTIQEALDDVLYWNGTNNFDIQQIIRVHYQTFPLYEIGSSTVMGLISPSLKPTSTYRLIIEGAANETKPTLIIGTDSRGIEATSVNNITIRRLHLTGPNGSSNNVSRAFNFTSSSNLIIDSVLMNNFGIGINLNNTISSVYNVLAYRNYQGMITDNNDNTTITNCTFNAMIDCAIKIGDTLGGVAGNIKNSVITNSGIGISLIMGALALSYSDIYGNALNFSGISNQIGLNGNISADPQYVDSGADNYQLKYGSYSGVLIKSPCADKATPTGAPAYDIDGRTRPR